jgi:hypothetical protein
LEYSDYDPDRDITGYSAFLCEANWTWFLQNGGTFKLNTPIDILAKMPGVRQKLLSVTVNCMYMSDWWTGAKEAHLELWGDNTKLWSSKTFEAKEDEWTPNRFEVNLDLSNVAKLDVFLPMYANAALGWVKDFVRAIKLDCEYYSEEPPVTASAKITVTNSETGAIVKGATVAIMSGTRVVASGYTDSSGNVTFNNVEEGSYTLKIVAGGYYSFETGISVKAPEVWYEAKIVPIPVAPTPNWVYWVVGGVAALGAITIIPSLVRRKAEEKVIVVR